MTQETQHIPPALYELVQPFVLKNEGKRSHCYVDSRGYETIGIGRNISESGPGLSNSEIDFMLGNDLWDVYNDLFNFPWFSLLTNPQKCAMMDMRFQLGPLGFRKFTSMLQSLEDRDFVKASQEILSSLYAKQVPKRALEVSNALRFGKLDL